MATLIQRIITVSAVGIGWRDALIDNHGRLIKRQRDEDWNDQLDFAQL
ncbi:MAG: hypothetical protein AAGA01_09890 [Cyanobacteria bacterium P01_E01_bin.43]